MKPQGLTIETKGPRLWVGWKGQRAQTLSLARLFSRVMISPGNRTVVYFTEAAVEMAEPGVEMSHRVADDVCNNPKTYVRLNASGQ